MGDNVQNNVNKVTRKHIVIMYENAIFAPNVFSVPIPWSECPISCADKVIRVYKKLFHTITSFLFIVS